jgi:hypothetical protein
LAKKRTSSPSNLTNLSTSYSQNKKKLKEEPKEISNQLSKEPIKNPVNIQSINQPKIKNVKWTQNEDNFLIKCVNKFGEGKWQEMERCFIGRTRKQLRQRYISILKVKKISENKNQIISLNSSFSGNDEKLINEKHSFIWNDKLDKILIREYFLNKKSWVKISKKIPGSSENSVKNRFYSLLRQLANKAKRKYKNDFYSISTDLNKDNMNNNLNLLIYKEIFGNGINSEKEINNLYEMKKMFLQSFVFNSEYFYSKSKKKNYSVEILLSFLPELLEDKGIDIMEILNELNQRKNNAANQIFVVMEKHFNCCKCDTTAGMTADAVFDSLKNAQTEKLGKVIRNMKLKIMSKYFHRFRYNTLGI